MTVCGDYDGKGQCMAVDDRDTSGCIGQCCRICRYEPGVKASQVYRKLYPPKDMIDDGENVKYVVKKLRNGLEKIVKVSLAAERGDSVVASNEDEEGAPSTIGRSIHDTNLQKNVSRLIRKLDPMVAITDVGDEEEGGSIETGTPGPVEMARGDRGRGGGGGRGGGSSVARSRRRERGRGQLGTRGSTRSLVTQ